VIARSPALPLSLAAVLGEIERRLESGDEFGCELDRALQLLATLPPDQIARADWAIAAAAGLYHRQPPPALRRLLPGHPNDKKRLLKTPGLEFLFLFHRDGRLREAALLKITEGLTSPFLFAAILWRLNDWAAPVRRAAIRCATRSFPLTRPEVVAEAAIKLLGRQLSWGRWNEERDLLDNVLARNDVADHLAQLIMRGATGPLASVLGYALRTPALDAHLHQIAMQAVQPSVRAVALDALINGKAKWLSGFAWQWIDKSHGMRRRVPVFAHRTLSVSFSKIELIARGVRDRSAVVRRTALTGVICYLPTTEEGQNYAAMLLEDRSPSVRERAEFILRSGTG